MHKVKAELGLAYQRWWSTTTTARARRSGAAATGKQSKGEGQRRWRLRLKRMARKLKEAASWPSPRQRDAQTATHATGSQPKLAGNVASAVDTVHSNYRNAICPKFKKLLSNFHNNSKISKNKSCSKSKVLQLCFYNHLLIQSRF